MDSDEIKARGEAFAAAVKAGRLSRGVVVKTLAGWERVGLVTEADVAAILALVDG